MRPFNFKTIFFTILLSLTVAFPASAEYFSDIIITSPDGIWTDERAYTSLSDAIDAVGSNNRTIVVASEEVVTNLTIPSNVTLDFRRGGKISYTGQLTINTPNIIASDYVIFNPSGLGEADFARGTNLQVAWFNNFNEASIQLSDDYVTIIINRDVTVSTNTTIPSNVKLVIEEGGLLSPSTNVTLTINSPANVQARADQQVFDGDGRVVFTLSGVKYADWFGAVADGSTDNGPMITAAIASGGGVLKFALSGIYAHATQITNGSATVVPTEGITFEGISVTGNSSITTGTVIKWTGFGIGWYFTSPIGSSEYGRWRFKDLSFNATQANGGVFSFHDISMSPTDGGTTPCYFTGIRFENCKFWGAGATSTADGIRATKTFELVIDDSCYFRGFRRGVYLRGSDNCTIGGRYIGNGRHIHAELSGTFGSGLLITARFLGPCSANAAEANHQLYLDTRNATVLRPYFEGYTDGFMWIGRELITIIDPYFSGTGPAPHNIYFYLASGAAEVTMYSPRVTTGLRDRAAVTIEDPANYEWYGSNEYRKSMTIVRPSAYFVRYVLGTNATNPRLRIVDGGIAGTPDHKSENIVINANGIRKKSYYLTPFDLEYTQTTSVGYSAISGIVEDAGGFYGRAIALSTTGNYSGIVRRLIVGKDIFNGDVLNITYYYRLEAPKSVGSFRYQIFKNSANVTNREIGSSTTYTSYSTQYTVAGAEVGDEIQIGAFQAGMDVRAFLAGMTIDVYQTESVSSGTGTVKMGNAGNANNAGWVEIYPDKWIPYWSDPTP